jgi:uncharacterized membrane protein YfcA
VLIAVTWVVVAMIAAGLVLAGVTTVVSQRRGGTLADANRSQWLGNAIIALVGAAILAVVAATNTQDRFVWVVAAFLLLTGGRQLSRWWVARQSS